MALFGRRNDKENSENEEQNGKTVNEENGATEETTSAAESTDASENAVSVSEEKPVEPKRYETPEGFDFNRYFLAERRIILDNVSYETQRATPGQLNLNVKDTIVAQVMGQAGVKVTYNRMLAFTPDGPFRLSVTFGVMLVFNPGTRDEVDWHKIDVANEFKKNCAGLVDVMASKAALIVAELTNASGGSPIILRK